MILFFQLFQEWRAENKPEEMRLQKASFDSVLKSGLVYWHKHDKQGRPCVVVFPRQHFPGKTTLECTYQACVYFLESARNKYARHHLVTVVVVVVVVVYLALMVGDSHEVFSFVSTTTSTKG